MVLEHRNLSQMLETAVVAARLAGQKAMEELSFIKVSVKNGDELVTQADAKCQKIIIDRIKETYPDHGFIGEEGSDGKLFKQSPRGADDLWWVIDPIDGTNNFANQILLFSVSIGVFYEGRPIIGVIFEPATDSMFTAVKDGEAQLNGRRIETGQQLLDKFSSVGLDSNFGGPVPGWAQELMLRTRYRNLGSTALHLAYTAKGSFAVAVACSKLWDIAAGAVLVELAGGEFTDQQGKEIFPVDLENYESELISFIASNKKVHKEILKLIEAAAI